MNLYYDEMMNKLGDGLIKSLSTFNTSKIKYFGDLQAAEKLKNDSICVMENGTIRSLKGNEMINDQILVHVNNWSPFGEEKNYIEQGEYVRYTTI